MHCRACDAILNDFESTRKSVVTQEYYELCNECFNQIRRDVLYRERIDLMRLSDDLPSSGTIEEL